MNSPCVTSYAYLYQKVKNKDFNFANFWGSLVNGQNVKKRQKTSGYLTFPGGLETVRWRDTVRKLCLSTKFPHFKIRWNSNIFRSEKWPLTSGAL